MTAVTVEDMANAVQDFWRLSDLVTPMAVRAAATLGLADYVLDGVDTLEELAGAAQVNMRPLRSLLDHLVSTGFFSVNAAHQYSLTTLGRTLSREGWGAPLREMVDLECLAGRAEFALIGLLHTLKTGRPAHEYVYGCDVWTDAQNHPELVSSAGNDDVGLDAQLIIEEFDWSGVRSVVDLGGNKGNLIAKILRENPGLRGLVLDLSCHSSAARETFRTSGVSERASFRSASFFEELPTGYDIYVLSAILADWSDSDALRILSGCASAIRGTSGMLLVSEVHSAGLTDLNPPFDTAMGIRLDASITTPHRTPEDIVALASQAGLHLAGRAPGTPLRSLMSFTAK